MTEQHPAGRNSGEHTDHGNRSDRTDRTDRNGHANSDDEPVLPRTPEDERDYAWGDEPRDVRRDADWYRRERPPHHE